VGRPLGWTPPEEDRLGSMAPSIPAATMMDDWCLRIGQPSHRRVATEQLQEANPQPTLGEGGTYEPRPAQIQIPDEILDFDLM